MKRWTTAAATLLMGLAFATPASATTQTASLDLPHTQPPSLTPDQAFPDMQHIAVTYDTSGSITVAITFYEPLHDATGLGAIISVAQKTEPGLHGQRACYEITKGDISLLTSEIGIGEAMPGVFAAEVPMLMVTGFDGGIDGTATISNDHRTLTYSASHSAIANHTYQCATVELAVGGRPSLGISQQSGTIYFPGYPANTATRPRRMTPSTQRAKALRRCRRQHGVRRTRCIARANHAYAIKRCHRAHGKRRRACIKRANHRYTRAIKRSRRG